MKPLILSALIASGLLLPYAASAGVGDSAPAHVMEGMGMESKASKVPKAPSYTASVDEGPGLEAGRSRSITVRLADSKGPLGPERIDLAHTRRVHLLVIDESLADYQHVHPEPGNEAGSYVASFTPKTEHSYKIWVDVTPTGGAQAFVPVALKGAEACGAQCIDKKEVMRAEREGLVFTLSFEEAPSAGKAVMGKLEITDASGKPIAQLEPVMGAFAHIVGFGEGRDNVVHIHPMGAEPKAPEDRGISPLTFHIEPATSGFVKLWAQIRLDGKELFIPFGFDVKK